MSRNQWELSLSIAWSKNVKSTNKLFTETSKKFYSDHTRKFTYNLWFPQPSFAKALELRPQQRDILRQKKTTLVAQKSVFYDMFYNYYLKALIFKSKLIFKQVMASEYFKNVTFGRHLVPIIPLPSPLLRFFFLRKMPAYNSRNLTYLLPRCDC